MYRTKFWKGLNTELPSLCGVMNDINSWPQCVKICRVISTKEVCLSLLTSRIFTGAQSHIACILSFCFWFLLEVRLMSSVSIYSSGQNLYCIDKSPHYKSYFLDCLMARAHRQSKSRTFQEPRDYLPVVKHKDQIFLWVKLIFHYTCSYYFNFNFGRYEMRQGKLRKYLDKSKNYLNLKRKKLGNAMQYLLMS